MKTSTFSIFFLGAFAAACSKSEPVQNKYADASDVPSPSDDIDEIPLEDLQEADENREEGNNGGDSGDGSKTASFTCRCSRTTMPH